MSGRPLYFRKEHCYLQLKLHYEITTAKRKKKEDLESIIRNGMRDLKNGRYVRLSLTNKASTWDL